MELNGHDWRPYTSLWDICERCRGHRRRETADKPWWYLTVESHLPSPNDPGCHPPEVGACCAWCGTEVKESLPAKEM